ncbi:LacI family DNA-binding transcriptional regulator [Mahella australiensis]|uniref:Transcriptional regulator, LacI family n=1 Tax=Mahella australiensis (strain DSM 15567 / CIP 107919 / 50-1 BON) TaxID=697281 RepID=F3ZY44_MAHA5|nr:LacI family DNA-binding transcriptional regulator [Mahella australiensis]AEE97740.1 transcriptional regulator, LacI family [Mahella australiensis 50-1 BON]
MKVKEIAEKLNVSPATVSLVLNNKPGVSEKTRQRVLQAVAEAGYDTNILSKPALRDHKAMRFIIYKKHGHVVGDTPFFSALMEGIDLEARKKGYSAVISYINDDQNKNDILRLIKDHPLNGIIILATEMDCNDLQPFIDMPVPVVLLDSFCRDIPLDSVVINNVQGAYNATKHLIDKGHTDIGYLHSSVWINNFDERTDGFLKALSDHNIKFNKKNMFSLESTLDGAYRDMLEILQSNADLPTALFADNDIIAFGAIKALKEKGISIPDEVSIVGFDDMPFCNIIDPPLTTVRVYKQDIGRLAVRRLIEKIRYNSNIFVNIEVGTELVERQSVLDKTRKDNNRNGI